jgi:hypothetical protein
LLLPHFASRTWGCVPALVVVNDETGKHQQHKYGKAPPVAQPLALHFLVDLLLIDHVH